MQIPVKKCQLCGALVADTPDDIALHARWHGQLRKPAIPIIAGTTAVLGTNVTDDENAAALSSLAHDEKLDPEFTETLTEGGEKAAKLGAQIKAYRSAPPIAEAPSPLPHAVWPGPASTPLPRRPR